MNGRPTLADLEAFAAIAARRSFRQAADDLGLSPSTLSHMMRALEGRMGVRLLHRTTRSVSPTEAGQALLDRLRPVLRALDQALDVVGDYGGQPAGTLRINADEAAARVLLRSIVPTFHEQFPLVALDLVTDGRFVDIVEEGFDAGVRLGEAVPKDMVAVRFGGDARFVAVASRPLRANSQRSGNRHRRTRPAYARPSGVDGRSSRRWTRHRLSRRALGGATDRIRRARPRAKRLVPNDPRTVPILSGTPTRSDCAQGIHRRAQNRSLMLL